jgi:hypothetical protein
MSIQNPRPRPPTSGRASDAWLVEQALWYAPPTAFGKPSRRRASRFSIEQFMEGIRHAVTGFEHHAARAEATA